jgi:hypothetical protein
LPERGRLRGSEGGRADGWGWLIAAEGEAWARKRRWAAWAERGTGARREGVGPDSAQPRGRRFSFFFFYFHFHFYFFYLIFSFEQIFSYIFLGVKNTLCEVLLTIMVYAYDEVSYEVGSRG